ncbi:MAG: phosphate acyltransferase PlsX [Tissierellia bacterium]|nr:phosphate acyltransferase PlsX [Tissierellia bacterium]
MRIIVDGMGGDRGPGEIVRGCVDAIGEQDVNIIIAGKRDILEGELLKYNFPRERIDIIDADEVISNDEEPTLAIRRKKNSSMVMGMKALAEGTGDGFLSAGSTGALLAGGLFIVKRIKGIERAALTTVYPTTEGVSLLLDAGANIDCKPQYLGQFAIMGSIYSEKVLGVKNPRVGLANIGTEEGKGNALTKESYNLIGDLDINFAGNVEARDLPNGVVDVIVCDGFVGNIILKLTEGMAISIFSLLKDEFSSSLRSKVGALILKQQLRGLKGKLDYREYGGAPLLGVRRPVFKAHGSSDALAIKNAIRQMKAFIDGNVIDIIDRYINDNK